ncbi:MAG: hpdA [Anaerosporomusa subterranea]|jgi:pyruvate formate lyase activating enzyme|nr:hpdA [Anaerosporomusa subterranea]
MKEMKGLVFDIQSYSVHDGPGCRTLVFLMGCPLRCTWCANPEGWEYKQRMMYRMTKCIHDSQGCIRCVGRCPQHAITAGEDGKGPLVIDWSKCKTCDTFDCTQACLKESMVVCGKWYSVEDLMRIFSRDRHYWSGSGGVTFSGGDALVQKDFLIAILKRCQEAYIHTAIETSSCFPQEQFLEVMKHVNFAFVDIKHMNDEKHRQQTAVSNARTLENLKALTDMKWPGRVIIRIPVIPGFNDDDENIVATAQFAKSIGLKEINLLPFHRLGDSKWNQCGMTYPYREQEAPAPEKMQHLKELITEQGITAYVGSDTPF